MELKKICLLLLFGKYALDGYYTSPQDRPNKNYILDSIFPSKEAMDTALTVD